MPASYEVAVIGRGLIGSAAARHLAEAGHKVVVIGPDEHLTDEPVKGRFVVTPMKGELHGSPGEPVSGRSWLLVR